MFCYRSRKSSFVCPGASGPECTVYSHHGIRRVNKTGKCVFRDMRDPMKKRKADAKKRVGQQKQKKTK